MFQQEWVDLCSKKRAPKFHYNSYKNNVVDMVPKFMITKNEEITMEANKKAMKSMGSQRGGYKSETKSGYKDMYKSETKGGKGMKYWGRA